MVKHRHRRYRDEHTPDLFEHERLFPVRAPRALGSALDFNARMAVSMAEAIDEARSRNIDRFEIARRMSVMLGREVKKSMIDAYTSQARETHTIALVRFVAFVRATECTWLWDAVLQDEGLIIVQGEDAQLAQAAMAEKMAAHYAAEARRLKAATPLNVSRGARR